MRTNPKIKKKVEADASKNIEKAAVAFAFAGVYIWFFKLLFF